jgi:hypothetical protein
MRQVGRVTKSKETNEDTAASGPRRVLPEPIISGRRVLLLFDKIVAS